MAKELTHIRYLKSLKACSRAIGFARGYNTLQEAWDACDRPGWLLWLLTKQASGIGSASRKAVAYAAAQCARAGLKFTEDPRVLACIYTTEGYIRGENKLEDVIEAAGSAANAYAAAYGSDAAYAAAYAAAAASAVTTYPSYASFAAYAAEPSGQAHFLDCANIIRQLFPKIRMGRWVVKPTNKGGQHD